VKDLGGKEALRVLHRGNSWSGDAQTCQKSGTPLLANFALAVRRFTASEKGTAFYLLESLQRPTGEHSPQLLSV